MRKDGAELENKKLSHDIYVLGEDLATLYLVWTPSIHVDSASRAVQVPDVWYPRQSTLFIFKRLRNTILFLTAVFNSRAALVDCVRTEFLLRSHMVVLHV